MVRRSTRKRRPEAVRAAFGRDSRGSAGADLADLAAAGGDRLHVEVGVGRHLYLEDARGLRLADLHPGLKQRVVVLLPPARPLFVRAPARGEEVELPAGSPVRLSAAAFRPAAARVRGAEHVAFMRLFVRPFDGAAVETYRATLSHVEIRDRPVGTARGWRVGLGITGLACATVAATMTALALQARYGAGDATAGRERGELNRRIDAFNVAAVVGYALAGAALGTYLVWTLSLRRGVQVRVLPAGAGLHLSMRLP